MKLELIEAKQLQAMIIAGAQLLDEKKEIVNELNVFPVPDGDTGTNMSLTMLAAAKEVQQAEVYTATEVVKAAASGSLRGARGNSGVILSQLIRGFAKGIEDQQEIDTVVIANAFQKGVDTAYKAVMKPKEGTILTVAREVALKALELSVEVSDMESFFLGILQHGYKVLNQTPDMLPILKEAGVVDAGGQGLLYILEGASQVIIHNLEVEIKKLQSTPTQPSFDALKQFDTQDISFGYCTEFLIQNAKEISFKEAEFKAYLESIGDSIVVVSDEEYTKVHVHTDNPGLAIQKALTFGILDHIKIENMRIQHALVSNAKQEDKILHTKDLAFVAVASGEGIKEILESLGVDQVITGGQTMNPSTEDILKAIKDTHAKEVVVLPNNKNIILAAEQAAALEESAKVYVIPTTTLPQGIAAMIAQDGVTENRDNMIQKMKLAISQVQTAQITIAVRDTVIEGQNITEGEYLGLLEGKIVVHHEELKEAFKLLLSKMKQDAEIITLYYGEEVSQETAQNFYQEAQEIYQDAEVELYNGNQPVYYFMISAE